MTKHATIWLPIRSHLNFYRIHLLAFITLPLVGAAVLWGSNGKFPVKFTDALYISVSAATGTGLTTIDLSSLTVWQQVILVILELVGNQASVAWTVVLIRRWYFLRNLRHIVAAEMARTRTNNTRSSHNLSPTKRYIRDALARFRQQRHEPTNVVPNGNLKAGQRKRDFIRPDTVRRLDLPPQPIDPIGRASPVLEVHDGIIPSASVDSLPRAPSRHSLRLVASPRCPPGAEDDFGGFPGVQNIASRVINKLPRRFQAKLKRTLTVPRTETLVPPSGRAGLSPDGPVRIVPYLSFRALVERNSTFYGLTEENVEELGGVEYRALSALLWIIPVYYIGLLSISFVVTAPYMSLPKWQENFLPPLQHRKINPIWFSAFQVVGAWANTGMSLVDQNMVPFQTAYPLVAFLVICVLAGNTCLPIFLRFFIWCLTLLPGRSRLKEVLYFLLDHPRRCTFYLFPARQTWLLLGTVIVLNCTNLLFYLVLNIGNPVTEALPFGVKIVDAVLNAAACRNAGYQPIPVSELMPAVQVLSVVMMYIAIYPIAMSVRATNVYEKQSLGVYLPEEDDDEMDDDTHWNRPSESRVAIWGKYLIRHARRQLSFDMWWLAVSLFLLCIIERDNLIDPAKQSYFNIFALIFELVSAYGTVGLSLGIPGLNYSLSGGMHTLSKLIVIVVMLRGRHRGLPVALDRAVLFPSEFLETRRRAQESGYEEEDGIDENDREPSGVLPPLQNSGELAARMRTRTRTISLIVEEKREPQVGMTTDWKVDGITEACGGEDSGEDSKQSHGTDDKRGRL